MYASAGSPFDLQNDAAWQAWRAEKLASLPGSIDAMRVHLADPCHPTPQELDKLASVHLRYQYFFVTTE